jgi:type IX secretion system PorP/SprF family membrane protein
MVGILLLQFRGDAQQQMENSMSQYFRSPMMWNAGFTGADGNKIYAMQNRSWIGFDGAPVLTNISGEMVFGANSAVGVQLLSDLTGVLHRTYGVFNYAYRIKLNKRDDQLRLGISLAFSGDRVNNNYVDQNGVIDQAILNDINTRLQFDANIGAVYTRDKLTVGVSFYRLRENFGVLSGGEANLAFAQMGGTYDININNDENLHLKPLLMLRLYRGTNALVDMGGQFEYNKMLNAMLVYQSSGNIRSGAGVRLNQFIDANFFYNTNVLVANTSSQQYELGIGFHFKGKKQ